VSRRKTLSIGLIWAQFAAYHVDRCEAVALRLGDRAKVVAIEVATTSVDYAWEPSGGVAGADKQTLFPGRSFDAVPLLRRYAAMLRASWRCDLVCIGLSYGLVDAILLSWTLRLLGRRVVVLSESKFDDKPRRLGFELLKVAVLACYEAAIVGGRRHGDYFRFLGFSRRPVLPGYDGVGIRRIREQAQAEAGDPPPYAARPFLFVGRFVDKKNLFALLRGFAGYAADARRPVRRLVLVGSGHEEQALRGLVQELGLDGLVDFPGFLPARAVAQALRGAVALVLVSREEQWGLVVNEALALDLPVIVSNEVGSLDLLVRNLVNGFVVDANAPQVIGAAMLRLAEDEATWQAMSRAAGERAWMGDAARLADAIEVLLFTDSPDANERVGALRAEMENTFP